MRKRERRLAGQLIGEAVALISGLGPARPDPVVMAAGRVNVMADLVAGWWRQIAGRQIVDDQGQAWVAVPPQMAWPAGGATRVGGQLLHVDTIKHAASEFQMMLQGPSPVEADRLAEALPATQREALRRLAAVWAEGAWLRGDADEVPWRAAAHAITAVLGDQAPQGVHWPPWLPADQVPGFEELVSRLVVIRDAWAQAAGYAPTTRAAAERLMEPLVHADPDDPDDGDDEPMAVDELVSMGRFIARQGELLGVLVGFAQHAMQDAVAAQGAVTPPVTPRPAAVMRPLDGSGYTMGGSGSGMGQGGGGASSSAGGNATGTAGGGGGGRPFAGTGYDMGRHDFRATLIDVWQAAGNDAELLEDLRGLLDMPDLEWPDRGPAVRD
jgi:uncharacterized membrane protein YgcG